MTVSEKCIVGKQVWPILLGSLPLWICGLQGCFTSQSSTPVSMNVSRDNPRRPVLTSKEMFPQARYFESNLPLGIGARVDLFVSNRADDLTDLYQSYIRPIQKGKIFYQRPYQLDYSILPKKGEAFEEKGSLLNSLSIRSDYAIQIGMSRRFGELSDFLKPSFWLGLDQFAPTPDPRPQIPGEEIADQADPFSPESNLPPDGTAGPVWDLEDLIESRWGLQEP